MFLELFLGGRKQNARKTDSSEHINKPARIHGSYNLYFGAAIDMNDSIEIRFRAANKFQK